jgi:hypothetical protein
VEALMRVAVRGWSRDHGETEIVNTDQLDDMPVAPSGSISLKPGETYLQVSKSRSSCTVHVWGDAKLNLNGSYMTHVELDRRDIARVFYLAYGDRKSDEIIRLLDAYREQEKQQAAAVSVSKEDARKAIVEQWQLLPTADRANIHQACQFVIDAMKRYSWRQSAGAYQEAMAWLQPYVGQA